MMAYLNEQTSSVFSKLLKLLKSNGK